MRYISLLGRQPALGVAELERVFGGTNVDIFSDTSAVIETDHLDIQKLGGTIKAGVVIADLSGDWRTVSQKIVSHYTEQWSGRDGKTTLGISVYGFEIGTRDVQKTGLLLKQKLKQAHSSLRLIPNQTIELSSATSHHNKLGLSDNKVELLVVKNRTGKIIIAESTGSQNITAYAKRDQGRPKRDAFVGMLPPKLAQMMVNLAHPANGARVLDPFCGTGVVLQESVLLGYDAYGTDLSEKMIDFSEQNMAWLGSTHRIEASWAVHAGDAMTTKWIAPIDTVVGEAYLGQPFSAPPSPSKLREVRDNCDHIIGTFLKNIAPQLAAGTPLCLAVPAWKSTDGSFTHLSLVANLSSYGFEEVRFENIAQTDLLYYRDDQVVARELLVLIKK